MYPAQGLTDGLYTAADLPDSVEVFDQFNTYTYTKNGSIYIFSNQSLRAVDGRWAPFLDEDELGDRSQPCLIAPNDTLRVTDLFADTYTVTTPFSSGIVTRFALCNWAGIDGNGCPLQLLYGGFEGDPETAESGLKWSVSFQEYEEPEGLPAGCTVSYGRLKGGFQNSPVGTYNIVYATEGSEFATVS
jgi:hypothetical protein